MSTARLYTFTQPGHSLWSLGQSNLFNANLLLAPGARLDYFGDLRHLSVDPRFAARYEFPQGTVLKGGVGYYPNKGFIHVDTGDVRQWNGR